MANTKNLNPYEEARKKRLEENQKRFQELGIVKISDKLNQIVKAEKKSVKREVKPRMKLIINELFEPRRSSRARNAIVSYADEVNINFPSPRKRSRSSRLNSNWTSYIVRPLDEVRIASYKERENAIAEATNFQNSLTSGCPSFVKSMVRSHVYSCFWLGLPRPFCSTHLPLREMKVILEDENESECEAVYIGSRTGLSGGWRGFALDHNLDDGDALIFELTEPARFKVYIFKAIEIIGDKDSGEVPKSRKPLKSGKNSQISGKGGKKAAIAKKRKKNDSSDDDVFSEDAGECISASEADVKDDDCPSSDTQQGGSSVAVAKDVAPEPVKGGRSTRSMRSTLVKPFE